MCRRKSTLDVLSARVSLCYDECMGTSARRFGSSLLVCSLLGSAALAACGGDPETTSGSGISAGAGGSAGATNGSGGGIVIDGNAGSGDPGGGTVTDMGLVIDLDAPQISVSGEPVSIELGVTYEDGSAPNGAVWSVDDTRIGSIDQNGVFTANGWVAGTVTVTVTVGSQTTTIEISVSVDISENPGDVAKDDRDSLVGGGSGGPSGIGPDADLRFLYPYDETVFPRGLSAPLLQLAGAAAEATYVVLQVGDFKYQAFYAGSGPLQITISQQAWKGATLSATADDWLTVSVTKLSGGEVTGPVSERYRIAQGSLKGIVYYNTYRSPLAGEEGAVMRIKPGSDAEVLMAGCHVCHAVSSQGNRLVSGIDWDNGNPIDSGAFELSADGEATPLNVDAEGRKYAFGALTPDGSLMMVSAVPDSGPKPRGLDPTYTSRLIDPATGADVATSGWDYDQAQTPVFSHDGSLIAFARGGSDAAHILSVMGFDNSGAKPAFSDSRNVVTDDTKVVAWPSFLPDSGGVVFQEGDSFDTATYGGGALYANLRLVDLADDSVVALDRLNGWNDSGESYLPYGEAEEQNLDYEPTVLPVPVGGFYWVLFTSRRCYGNTLAPGGTDGGDNKWQAEGDQAENPSPRKKIWIAAIDLDYTGKLDPSHPAFYLPGQELDAGNMRAFAALEPCKPQGASCESGAECCDGFCRETGKNDDGTPILECVPPPENSCSNVDETCATAGDCCNSKYLCINGRCAEPAAPPPK